MGIILKNIMTVQTNFISFGALWRNDAHGRLLKPKFWTQIVGKMPKIICSWGYARKNYFREDTSLICAFYWQQDSKISSKCEFIFSIVFPKAGGLVLKIWFLIKFSMANKVVTHHERNHYSDSFLNEMWPKSPLFSKFLIFYFSTTPWPKQKITLKKHKKMRNLLRCYHFFL